MLFNQFYKVNGFHFSLHTAGFNGIFYIDHTKWAGGNDDVRSGCLCHFYPDLPHPFFLYGLIKSYNFV